ncbi:MAG: HAMP domain-containing histidine kinase [Oscillospiraceae bacterium]|nr:HAMP domain-containing histidine kinase [Oscillospiraceae bacterium]
MAIKQLTRRWLYNSFAVILAIVITLVLASAALVRAYYYNNVRQSMMSQANYVDSLLMRYSEDSSVDYYSQLRRTVEDFELKERMELMAIGLNGQVLVTSSGFEPEDKLYMPDFEQAKESGQSTGEFIGSVNQEKIMAITMLTDSGNQEVEAMRYVVSLTLVDQQIVKVIALVTIVGMAILLFVIYSSSYFISSIVNPVGRIGETARRIAQGDLSVRLSKANDDEIGDLCDTINYMAEELSATEQMKNEFISSVSHELRTPLTAIKGWGETLTSGEVDQEMLQKGMHVILSETERLSSMVEELLDFSRIQNGRFTMNFGKVDIVAELSDAVLMFSERARRDNRTLEYTEPEGFAVMQADRNRLRQVFVNIIDNALKYSDSGDTVTVTANLLPGSFVVSVADTGIGISPEDLPKVKTKFYKANSTRRGSGIGLAVADEIVRMHGGSLDIASKLGEGTTVTITLPLLQEEKSS